MRIRNYISALAVILLTAAPSFGQEAPDTVTSYPGIEIITGVDPSEIYIGDLVTYTLTIKYDSTCEMVPPPLGSNLGGLEVKAYDADILTSLDDGRMQSENIFIISTFTTGDYVIPPIPIVFNLPDGEQKVLVSEAMPIKVLSLLGSESDSLDIKPLKQQRSHSDFEEGIAQHYIWGAIILAVVILVGLFLWFSYRLRKRETEHIDLRPAWEVAFEKLAVLKEQNLPQEGHFKEFYVELTDIVRVYYERMYSFNVMDMTTSEFLAIFSTRELPEGLLDRMERFFAHADLVKFAKYIPEVERTEDDFEQIHEAVESVRAEWERRLLPEISTEEVAGSGTARGEEVAS